MLSLRSSTCLCVRRRRIWSALPKILLLFVVCVCVSYSAAIAGVRPSGMRSVLSACQSSTHIDKTWRRCASSAWCFFQCGEHGGVLCKKKPSKCTCRSALRADLGRAILLNGFPHCMPPLKLRSTLLSSMFRDELPQWVCVKHVETYWAAWASFGVGCAIASFCLNGILCYIVVHAVGGEAVVEDFWPCKKLPRQFAWYSRTS